MTKTASQSLMRFARRVNLLTFVKQQLVHQSEPGQQAELYQFFRMRCWSNLLSDSDYRI